jgi:hypothetical protein
MDYENAIINALGKNWERPSYEPHWDRKYKRPTNHSATTQELIKATHLDEKTIMQTCNKLLEQGKIFSKNNNSQWCAMSWWVLK